MQKLELQGYDPDLPGRMDVAVMMEKRPSTHPWAEYRYDALGVVVQENAGERKVTRVFEDGEVEHFLVTGLSISLYLDECESYYHNLMSPQPGCFIVASQPDDSREMPMPLLVSLSFDEAHAYLEGDQQVFSVGIPPELYRWSEAYVLTHYIAEKKMKRKLKNWSAPEGGAGKPR